MSYISGGSLKGVQQLKSPSVTPGLSSVGEGRSYYDDVRKAFMASQDGGPYLASAPGMTTFVFRPGDPAPAVNVFTVWQDLVDALNAPAACVGRRYVQIDDSISPCVVPAGSYDFIGAGEIIWGGIFSNTVGLFTELTISDGVDFPSGCFFYVTDFLVVTTEGTTPAITIPAGERGFFVLDQGGRFVATGSAPLIDCPDGTLIFELGVIGGILNGGTPVVNAGATTGITVLVNGFFATLTTDAISGDVGSSLSITIINPATGNLGDQTVVFLGTTFISVAVRAARVSLAPAFASSAYDVDALESVVTGDATGGSFPVNLPDADMSEGREITVKKIDASVNAVTVTPFSVSQTIDGATSVDLTTQYEFIRIVATSGVWYVIG